MALIQSLLSKSCIHDYDQPASLLLIMCKAGDQEGSDALQARHACPQNGNLFISEVRPSVSLVQMREPRTLLCLICNLATALSPSIFQSLSSFGKGFPSLADIDASSLTRPKYSMKPIPLSTCGNSVILANLGKKPRNQVEGPKLLI